MNDEQKRKRLLDFLDSKAFDPILETRPEKFSDQHKKEMFQDVRKSTDSEKRRFHEKYQTAEKVKSNYLSDLNSRTAARKDIELEKLGLPRLPQFRDQFMKLCDRLDV